MSPKLTAERTLSASEQRHVDAALSHWMPPLIPTYSTPLVDNLASPWKNTLVKTGVLAVGLGVLALFHPDIVKLIRHGLARLVCGVFLVVFVVGMYVSRYRMNANIVDVLRRSPKGATWYDYLNSPVVQGELNRRAYGSGGGGAVAAGTGGFLGGMFGGRRRR